MRVPCTTSTTTRASVSVLDSKVRHPGTSGKIGAPWVARFPSPETSTVMVMGSPAAASLTSTDTEMEKFPTAPVKDGGAPAGRGRTLIGIGAVA